MIILAYSTWFYCLKILKIDVLINDNKYRAISVQSSEILDMTDEL